MRKLNRYTTLPVLLDILKEKRLVLLDPKTWDDKNDSEIILVYKKSKKLQKLFALCFSYGDETIHHWKAFADGSSGCCVEFDSEKLIDCIKNIKGIQYRKVTYTKINDVSPINVDDIPFTKRWPYRCEEEFRIVWSGHTSKDSFKIPIDLKMITKVTISQRMPQSVYDTVRDYLREAFSNPDQRINRSTLYENKIWINKFRKI